MPNCNCIEALISKSFVLTGTIMNMQSGDSRDNVPLLYQVKETASGKRNLTTTWIEMRHCPMCGAALNENTTDQPTVVTLCGSGRFREAFEQAEFDETLAGRIVLTIGCNTKDIARTPDLEHHKPMLDELHLRKIDLSDEILVLNVGGYVGESTRREIEYAKNTNKRVRWLEAPDA